MLGLFCGSDKKPRRDGDEGSATTSDRSLGSLISVRMTPGEVLDRLSILDIKRRYLNEDKAKIASEQYDDLRESCEHIFGHKSDVHSDILEKYRALVAVNEKLWDVEDEVRSVLRRALDANDAHDKGFTTLAGKVPILNDERAKLKNEIDEISGCSLTEVKGYV
jgi:hypothetical protein